MSEFKINNESKKSLRTASHKVESSYEFEKVRIYPKPLKPFSPVITHDENDFSKIEKTTLRLVWRLIEPYQRRIGRAVFHSFLTENEMLILKFRFNTREIVLTKLQEHGNKMLRLIGYLITVGLDNPTEFFVGLDRALLPHIKHAIDQTYLQLMGDKLVAYIINCDQLANKRSATMEYSVRKLINHIVQFSNPVQVARRTTSIRYRRSSVDNSSKKGVSHSETN